MLCENTCTTHDVFSFFFCPLIRFVKIGPEFEEEEEEEDI